MIIGRFLKKLSSFFIMIPFQLWLVIVVAFFLRLYHLGYNDLWYDEIITLIKLVHLNFIKVWNPPLYYAFLAGWVKIFGFSEFSLRFPSLLFNLACVPLVFLLGKELFNKSTALYASILFALSPFQLWYAQEARVYAFMLFCGLVSAYFQFLFMDRRKNKFLYGAIIFCISGLYSHPYYVFFAITQFICYLIFNKNKSAKILMVLLLIPLAFLPLLRITCFRLFWVLQSYWMPSPSWKSFLTTIENFTLGYNNNLWVYWLSDLLVLILVSMAVWFVSRRKIIKEKFMFCSFLFVMPMILAFLFSKLLVAVYFDRGLIFTAPYYYLILALGLHALSKKIVKSFFAAFAFLLLVVSIYGFFNNFMPTEHLHHVGAYIKKPIKPVVEFIKRNSGPNDIVAFTNQSIALPFIWYSEGKDAYFLGPMIKRNIVVKPYGKYRFFFVPESKTASYNRKMAGSDFYIPLHKVDKIKFEKLWVLSCNWQRDGNLDGNSLRVIKFLGENFHMDLRKEFDGLWLYRYEKQ